jgi:hypothetical protein
MSKDYKQSIFDDLCQAFRLPSKTKKTSSFEIPCSIFDIHFFM